MYEIGIDDLQKLIEDGRKAAAYAWEHYEELAARKHTYRLYGPHTILVGASIPGKKIPDRERQLRPKTRRKDYTIYELDENYNVIRTIMIMDYTRVDCTYHHFQLDGATYAYPFLGTEKLMYANRTMLLKFSDRRPVCFGELSENFAFVKFYEYDNAGKMMVSTYQYAPKSKFTVHGYPVAPDAPMGALNSAVVCYCREEPDTYIDFSYWFRK